MAGRFGSCLPFLGAGSGGLTLRGCPFALAAACGCRPDSRSLGFACVAFSLVDLGSALSIWLWSARMAVERALVIVCCADVVTALAVCARSDVLLARVHYAWLLTLHAGDTYFRLQCGLT